MTELNKMKLLECFARMDSLLKQDADITLCGGSSILLNYNFRDTTTDADCIEYYNIPKSVISRIAKENVLPDNWLNDDVCVTLSYSQKLIQYRALYKEYTKLRVYTITGVALLCMKLKSFRKASHDIDDIKKLSKILQSNGTTYEDVTSTIQKIYSENPTLTVDAEYLLRDCFNQSDSQLQLDDESVQSYIDMIKSGLVTIEDIPAEIREQIQDAYEKQTVDNVLSKAKMKVLAETPTVPGDNNYQLKAKLLADQNVQKLAYNVSDSTVAEYGFTHHIDIAFYAYEISRRT